MRVTPRWGGLWAVIWTRGIDGGGSARASKGTLLLVIGSRDTHVIHVVEVLWENKPWFIEIADLSFVAMPEAGDERQKELKM